MAGRRRKGFVADGNAQMVITPPADGVEYRVRKCARVGTAFKFMHATESAIGVALAKYWRPQDGHVFSIDLIHFFINN